MITTQIAISLAHQGPQGPLVMLEPEENLGLGGDQDFLAHRGCRDPLVNEVCLERKVKGVSGLQDPAGRLDRQVHKENLELVHQGLQAQEALLVPLVVPGTQVSEDPQVLLGIVIHRSVPASHTMDKAIQVPANKFSKSPVLLTV